MTEEMLSFSLKGENTGLEGSMCIKLPPKHQEPKVILDGPTKWNVFLSIVVILGAVVFVGTPLGLKWIFSEKETVNTSGKAIVELLDMRCLLIGWISIMATTVLLFGIYCWYRIRMVRVIADERELGYGVLKEFVGKLPETNQVYMLIMKLQEFLQKNAQISQNTRN